MSRNFWASYYDWLLEQIRFDKPEYDMLMEELYNRPFYYSEEFDENRAEEGLYLRSTFTADLKPGRANEVKKRECSILEMLIALSIRIDDEYIGDPSNPNPGMIFWEMISNLGLDKCTNRRFRIDFVDKVLTIWLDRDFKKNGEGSIFPLKYPKPEIPCRKEYSPRFRNLRSGKSSSDKFRAGSGSAPAHNSRSV